MNDIKINTVPRENYSKTRTYVVFDADHEPESVYEIPDDWDTYYKVTDILWKIHTHYDISTEFYDEMGIDFDSLLALVVNTEELPIILANNHVFSNNSEYWQSNPYVGRLTDIVSNKEEEKTPQAHK